MPGNIKRVRSHVIADLSENHIERFVYQAGHTIEFRRKDYGIDASIFTHNGNGVPEPGYISVQLKATDTMAVSSGYVKKQIDTKHLKQWATEAYPVILVFYDAKNDKAYWLHVQPYLVSLTRPLKQSAIVPISVKKVWNTRSVEAIRQLKNDIHRGFVRHR